MPAAAEPKAMGGIVKNNRVYLAVGAITIALASAACGSSGEKATSTTSTSTTSTTLAIALPADQVSFQGRGTITLADLGVGWTLDPTSVNDGGPAKETGGNCNGPNLAARMSGYVGKNAYKYKREQPTELELQIFTYVFPSVDAAKAAFARTVASYACNTWNEDGATYTLGVLPDLLVPCPSEATVDVRNGKKGRRGTTSTTKPACPVGDESIIRRLTGKVDEDSKYCNDGQVIINDDIVEVRIGAQVFRFAGGETPGDSCSDQSDAGPADTAAVFLVVQQAINKYQAELKQYTKEYYANLATTTTTRAAQTSD